MSRKCTYEFAVMNPNALDTKGAEYRFSHAELQRDATDITNNLFVMIDGNPTDGQHLVFTDFETELFKKLNLGVVLPPNEWVFFAVTFDLDLDTYAIFCNGEVLESGVYSDIWFDTSGGNADPGPFTFDISTGTNVYVSQYRKSDIVRYTAAYDINTATPNPALPDILYYSKVGQIGAENGIDGLVGIQNYEGEPTPFATFDYGLQSAIAGSQTDLIGAGISTTLGTPYAGAGQAGLENWLEPMPVGTTVSSSSIGSGYLLRTYFFPMRAGDRPYVVSTNFDNENAFTFDVVVGPDELNGESYTCTGSAVAASPATISITRNPNVGTR